ncbi:hypothetical protein ILYODFUR_014140 [Ilyodon furcidens]|uniref:Uncharacterized protein n=1 Tax=Ilyodon furcidens TaxID=33524 RepID=A0ABV0UGE1_9TELE
MFRVTRESRGCPKAKLAWYNLYRSSVNCRTNTETGDKSSAHQLTSCQLTQQISVHSGVQIFVFFVTSNTNCSFQIMILFSRGTKEAMQTNLAQCKNVITT